MSMFGKVFRIKTTAALGKHVAIEGILNIDPNNGGYLYSNGSLMTGTEIGYLDGVTAGTATASKAVVLGASKEIATITTATITTINASTVAFTASGGYLTMGTNSSTSGSAIPLTSSKTSILRAYGDDGGADIGAAAVRSGVFRFLCTVSAASETSMFGSQSQFKIKAPLDCTLATGNRAGSWNYLEIGGTATKTTTLTGANKFTGGAFGMVEWDGVGALTLSASHYMGAFGALTNIVKTGGTFTRSGILAAFLTVNNATASYLPFDWAFYGSAGSITQGIYLNSSAVGATGRIFQGYATMTNGALTDGYGIHEVDLTLAGTNTSHVAASSSWVNITTGTATAGTYVCARNDGIYEVTAATVTNAKLIFGARMQYLCEDTDGLRFPFSINTNNAAITALIDVNNRTDLGWVDAALSGATLDGHVPLFRDAAGVVHYVNTYID